MSRFLALALLALTACNPSLRVEPEGYACSTGGDCPVGYACLNFVCRAGGNACDGISCNSPPAAVCVDAVTRRSFSGHCVSGLCQYDPVDALCASGCANGTCEDACAGVVCDAPPAAACSDAQTLRTFAQTGTCEGGSCQYQATDTDCPNGCAQGVCQGVDLCVEHQVTCTTPPAPLCNGASRRTFTAPGTCNPGTGTCAYPSTEMQCPQGCALGQCLTASLTFKQVGPRLRFAVNALDVAPSSSGDSAVVVGDRGHLATWNGTQWTEQTTPGTSRLASVAFVTRTLAYAVGEGGAAWTVRPAMNQVAVATLPGTTANLVAVSGRSEQEVLVAGSAGQWWRLHTGAWTNGVLPSTNGALSMSAAFLDESLRERIAGACGTKRCVATRTLSAASPSWALVTQDGAPGFTAVGGSYATASSTSSEAMLGRADGTLVRHATLGTGAGALAGVTTAQPLAGAGVVGLSVQQSSTSASRDVFVLTGSTSTAPGHLYRVESSLVADSVTEALTTVGGEEHLSPGESYGVLVAQVRRAQGLNTIFRRGVTSDEVLELGEDFVGASVDGTGALVVATPTGDVATQATGASTFKYVRGGAGWSIEALDARGGAAPLLAGSLGGDGLLAWAGATPSTKTVAGRRLHGVCRVSDSEGWAVGDQGAVVSVTSSAVTPVSLSFTSTLRGVDCAAGEAVVCGDGGAVARFSHGTWVELPTGPGAFTTCRLVGTDVLAGGDGVLARFDGTGWTSLPARPGLRALVVAGPQEIYGAYGSPSTVARFDGAAWSPGLLQVSGSLGGGVHAGARVVWGGTLGALVEGR